ncbi:hypothetical protein ACS0TY_002932 [Phlomoides rotata]
MAMHVGHNPDKYQPHQPQTGIFDDVSFDPQQKIGEWIWSMSSSIFFFYLWYVWLARNKLHFDYVILDSQFLVTSARSSEQEFRPAQSREFAPRLQQVQERTRWDQARPSIESNVDIAEAYAALWGLRKAKEEQTDRIILETDSQKLYYALSSPRLNLSRFGEIVADIIIYILQGGLDSSDWVVKFSFKRSGQTIHAYFHNVLRVVLKLHGSLLAKPSPVTNDCTHPSWKQFKGCLGALDDTLIDVNIPEIDKARYRTRKGTVSVNMLVACDRGMRFIYMLAGWEGSAADARVLRDRDPNTRLMKSKSWPLYEDWCGIFGQSRATGKAGVSHLRATTPPPSFGANIDVDEASNKVGDETQDESESPSGHAQISESNDMGKTSSGRKRKTSLPADPMVCVVQNLCDTASNRLGEIAQRIGHDQDMSTARKMIYSSVSKMNMLTLQEKLHATTLIARNAEDIDVFFSLPDTDRVEWVTMLLNGDI